MADEGRVKGECGKDLHVPRSLFAHIPVVRMNNWPRSLMQIGLEIKPSAGELAPSDN